MAPYKLQFYVTSVINSGDITVYMIASPLRYYVIIARKGAFVLFILSHLIWSHFVCTECAVERSMQFAEDSATYFVLIGRSFGELEMKWIMSFWCMLITACCDLVGRCVGRESCGGL